MILAYIQELTAEFSTATNFTVWVLCYFNAFILVFYIRSRILKGKGWKPVDTVLSGAALESLGWGMHRQYYTVQNWAEATGIQELSDGMMANRWLTTVPFITVMMGGILLASPLTSKWSKYWFMYSVLALLILWQLAFYAVGGYS